MGDPGYPYGGGYDWWLWVLVIVVMGIFRGVSAGIIVTPTPHRARLDSPNPRNGLDVPRSGLGALPSGCTSHPLRATGSCVSRTSRRQVCSHAGRPLVEIVVTPGAMVANGHR